MKLYEIFKLPAMAIDVRVAGEELTLEFRIIAAAHGLTIDGQHGMSSNSTYQNRLPIIRRDVMRFGGQLLPKGGHREEAKRKDKFEDRVKAFLVELHKKLLQIQVHGLTGDLDFAHYVYIGHANNSDLSGQKLVEDMTAAQWFDSLPWERRNLRGISCTWSIARK